MTNKKVLSAALSAAMLMNSAAMGTAAAVKGTGDANGDGKLSVADLVTLDSYLLGSGALENAAESDLTGDGRVDVYDLIVLRQKLVDMGEDISPYYANHLTANIDADKNVKGSEADDEFIAGQMKFALELLQREYTDKQNTFISPCSVMQALALTANGAGGGTKAEMESVLGMDIDRLNNYLYTQRNSYTTGTYSNSPKMNIANSVWTRDCATAMPDFLNKAVSYYNADVFTAPFDGSTVSDINYWVSDKTENMIPQAIDQLGPDDMMCLINTVYFDALWSEPFDKSGDAMFTVIDGSHQNAHMMTSNEPCYISSDNAIGIYKNYSDGRYAFAAILPDEELSLTEYIEQLTPESLSAILNSKVKCDYNDYSRVYIPKFSFDFNTDLVNTLADMGMVSAFDDTRADFSNLLDIPTFISRIVHKTRIEFDECGTRAAAVTVMIPTCCAAPRTSRTINFNRPFLYCIVDTTTNLPIFMGTMLSIPEELPE